MSQIQAKLVPSMLHPQVAGNFSCWFLSLESRQYPHHTGHFRLGSRFDSCASALLSVWGGPVSEWRHAWHSGTHRLAARAYHQGERSLRQARSLGRHLRRRRLRPHFRSRAWYLDPALSPADGLNRQGHAWTSESGLAHNQGFCWHCWPSCLVDLTLAKPTDDIALYTKNILRYCGASFLLWIACLIAQPTPVHSHARVINHAGRARPTLQLRVCHCTCGARAAYR